MDLVVFYLASVVQTVTGFSTSHGLCSVDGTSISDDTQSILSAIYYLCNFSGSPSTLMPCTKHASLTLRFDCPF